MYIYDQVFSNGQLIFLNKLTVAQAFAKMVGNCLMSGHNFRLCNRLVFTCCLNQCLFSNGSECVHPYLGYDVWMPLAH